MQKSILIALSLVSVCFASARLFNHRQHSIDSKLSKWIEPRIVGGEDAKHGEFPHMLQLQYLGSHMCGASIISDQWALTAAHCVEGEALESMTLVAGQWKLEENDGTEQEKELEEVHIHPDYGSAGYDYDIAVVKVTTNFTFGEHVQPISLWTNADSPGGNARTSGWGRTSAGGPIPNVLQKLDVKVYEDSVCQDAYGDIFTENMVCAGNIEGGHCVCNGDSGSPLYTLESDKILQIGVVSWGNPCANPGYPAAYAEVGAFIDFVREHVPV